MISGNGSDGPANMQPAGEPVARRFTHDGKEWLAWPSGGSAYGTGTIGPAALEAVHFAPADRPETPAFEALIPAGKFFALYDDELTVLLRASTRVVEPGERPLKPATRRGEGLL